MPLHTGESSVYMAGRREWNERYGSYISRARRSELLSGVLAVSLAISALGNAWQAHSSHVEPFIEKVNQLGEMVGIQAIPVAPPPDAARIKAALGKWVRDVRTVYTDPIAELNTVTEAYAMTDKSGAAFNQLNDWFVANNPNVRAKNEEVGATIDSVGQIGPDTWSIDWTEDHRPKEGSAPYTSYWRISIRIKVVAPKDDKTLMENPNGVYAEWFNITPRTH